MLSNSAAPGAGGAYAGHRLQRSAAWPTDSGLISRDLFSAAPLHFFFQLCRRRTSSGVRASILTRLFRTGSLRPQACCGVVSNGCCEVSLTWGLIFELSGVLGAPNEAMTCVSCCAKRASNT